MLDHQEKIRVFDYLVTAFLKGYNEVFITRPMNNKNEKNAEQNRKRKDRCKIQKIHDNVTFSAPGKVYSVAMETANKFL